MKVEYRVNDGEVRTITLGADEGWIAEFAVEEAIDQLLENDRSWLAHPALVVEVLEPEKYRGLYDVEFSTVSFATLRDTE